MQEIIDKAEEYALKESAKPVRPLLQIANQRGQELAEKLNADKFVVNLGTIFMDLKRKQAVEENRLGEHAKMSADAAREFLKGFNLGTDIIEKVANCAEAHHGEVPFTCIEAEICANADAYKFLDPRGMLQFFMIMGGRDNSFKSALKMAEKKLDEKWNILTLDICKKELEPYYKQFKELLSKAKE